MKNASHVAIAGSNERMKYPGIKKGCPMMLLVFFIFQMIVPAVKAGSGNDEREMAERDDTSRRTIAYTLPWDDMPIDLSTVPKMGIR